MTFQKRSHNVKTNAEATFLKRFCASLVTRYFIWFYNTVTWVLHNLASTLNQSEQLRSFIFSHWTPKNLFKLCVCKLCRILHYWDDIALNLRETGFHWPMLSRIRAKSYTREHWSVKIRILAYFIQRVKTSYDC